MTTYTFNIKDALVFWAYDVVMLQREYNYTPPMGGFINNDETEYNAITWLDTEEKPTWIYLSQPISQGQIYVKSKYAGDNIVADEAAIAALQAAMPSAPVYADPTFSSITTATVLSSSRKAQVTYDIDASVNISLLAGQSITAVLTYADNSAMSTNPVIVSSQTTSNSGVLGLTQGNTLKIGGIIPPNKYRKVTFTVSSGATTPTALKAGQEVLL